MFWSFWGHLLSATHGHHNLPQPKLCHGLQVHGILNLIGMLILMAAMAHRSFTAVLLVAGPRLNGFLVGLEGQPNLPQQGVFHAQLDGYADPKAMQLVVTISVVLVMLVLQAPVFMMFIRMTGPSCFSWRKSVKVSKDPQATLVVYA